MTFEFLGTGTSQGIPVIGCTCSVCTSTNLKDKRNRCAGLFSAHNTTLLIDSGPDIRTQLLRAGVHQLDAALITHEHYDHIGGLDDLRPLGFISDGVRVFAQPNVMEQIKIKYDYAFGEQKYPGAPKFHLQPVFQNEDLLFGKVVVKPLSIQHGNLQIIGYCFDGTLMYITDANGIPDETLKAIKNIDTLIINALHHTAHHSHFTLSETLDTIQQINPRQTYIIHVSHHMGLHDVVNQRLPAGVFLAYDTLKLEL